MNQILQTIRAAVVDGEVPVVQQSTRDAIAAGLDPALILNEGMVSAMAEVGRRFECGDYYVPEMLIAARAMKEGMAILRPHLLKAKVASTGKVIIGTVQGDLHDIGKNLVCMMLEGAGFEIEDLGVDVSPEQYVQAVRATSPDIVAMSALLTTTMSNMQLVIDALKEAGFRDKVKVMVGGAPVTETYSRQIGADSYAQDASRAATQAKFLMATSPAGSQRATK
ncbi:MAG: corrinoid protein [Chloroflexi bacterium]|nr:corrinoid protein [Chloroflexota bacterium]